MNYFIDVYHGSTTSIHSPHGCIILPKITAPRNAIVWGVATMTLSASSKGVLFTTVFLSCVSFAIVMPTLWPYLHGLGSKKSFLAWVVSFYSVGEGVGAILLGTLVSRYSTRTIMIGAALLGVFGSALYATAAAFPARHIGAWMVFLGRFVQGVWSGGTQAVQQVHLAKTLPAEELTANTVTLNAYACLGFVIGPSFGLVFGAIPTVCLLDGKLCVDELTLPGYFVLLACIGIIMLFVFIFENEDESFPSISHYSSSHDPVLQNGIGQINSWRQVDAENGDVSHEFATSEQTPLLTGHLQRRARGQAGGGKYNFGIIVCNVVFFIHFYGFALQETITTPLVQAYYSWSVFTANLLFTVAGVCSLITFFAVSILSYRVSDRSFTCLSLALGGAGYALLITRLSSPPEESRFLFAFCLVSVAYPLGRTCVLALYTKILPPKLQGPGQGVILAVGALARILGPFMAVAVFRADAGGVFVFSISSGIFLATLAGFRAAYPTLEWKGRNGQEFGKGKELYPESSLCVVP